ncbi:required for meiotic nuclear division protein -like [Brachionus plicatilis]|uniref:Required for meiotic nuclear division protein-like n=1 Tax=Brachionus plicatilis TaxID=10195 RepID=A0A3M7SP28_BRAPC|nr:required for meiotic nuclear division protein -like [Brachionus plicatilis]
MLNLIFKPVQRSSCFLKKIFDIKSSSFEYQNVIKYRFLMTATSGSSYLSKQRPNKKKSKKIPQFTSIPMFKVKAYATADYYDLENIKISILNSEAYESVTVPNSEEADEFLCIKPKYEQINEIEPRHIFFFEDGSVVFWNLSNEEQRFILGLIEKHEENTYDYEIVEEESEVMNYSQLKYLFKEDFKQDEFNPVISNLVKFKGSYLDDKTTRLIDNQIYFSESGDQLLEKYAFSDAMALSVKLGIWEKNLEKFSEKIEYISDDMRRGKKLKLKLEKILKYLGELFTMRHVVSLHSNFLDTPDFYWDREKLETLYSQLYSHLSIAKRTRLYNERLNHCISLMEILKQHLTDKNSTRLEWIIIGLIALEVLIALGVFDFIKNLSKCLIEYTNDTFKKNK